MLLRDGYTLPHWGRDAPALKELMSQIHFVTACILIMLIVLHIAAVLKHRFIDRDGVFERMFPLFHAWIGADAGVTGNTIVPPRAKMS